MKTLMLIAGICCLGMTACAGSGSNAVVRTTSSPVDSSYVGKVESLAANNGVQVKWINPPQKRVISK